GRCLPLPATCQGDAGTTADGGACISACEYHPPSGGQLNAITKWTWGPAAKQFPAFTDVWSTPNIGRVHDNNCDGKVDDLDTPVVVFVSGKALDVNTGIGTCCQCNGGTPSACHTGVLRMLDGATGAEIWSLAKASPSSSGFAGFSNAIGDVDGDGVMDIVAVTGEGYVVLVDSTGKVLRTSDKPIPGAADVSFGWGGGLALADMDGDGHPEIAFGATVFSTTNNAITLKWTGAGGAGGGSVSEYTSTFVDIDGANDNHLELLAGRTAYNANGTILWDRPSLPDGFSGVGDFNQDGKPEAVLVANGQLWILAGATGATLLGPVALPGTGSGGPPTVADFDGDKKPEIGVAMATFYDVMKPDFVANKINVLWQTPNHDLSSSVTGSTVFDFEGDGKAEVVYGDECFLWVFDGTTGAVRFAAPHSSFTGTEASLVADVDGDGHAEMLMVSNSADPSSAGWKCKDANNVPVTVNGHKWVPGPAVGTSYRGLSLFGDSASSWVGTRTLWNEHTYHVSNVCDARDQACAAPNLYGSIPKVETRNWTVPWLNDFRQNVQDKGLFNAPDAIVSLKADCTQPVAAHVSVRNVGTSGLPAGVDVGVFIASNDVQVGKVTTTLALLPGQTQTLDVTLTAPATPQNSYYAKILLNLANPKFHECREDNDKSDVVGTGCVN
ncbi:MAG TPA: VCBS repeat-containing protein, partial [Polyangiaceae bacterium]